MFGIRSGMGHRTIDKLITSACITCGMEQSAIYTYHVCLVSEVGRHSELSEERRRQYIPLLSDCPHHRTEWVSVMLFSLISL